MMMMLDDNKKRGGRDRVRQGSKREEEERLQETERKRETKKILQPESQTRATLLPIIQSPSPDLRFAHRHFRWEASTATYTPDQATRRGSGARRRTAARKAAGEVKSLKTFP